MSGQEITFTGFVDHLDARGYSKVEGTVRVGADVALARDGLVAVVATGLRNKEHSDLYGLLARAKGESVPVTVTGRTTEYRSVGRGVVRLVSVYAMGQEWRRNARRQTPAR